MVIDVSFAMDLNWILEIRFSSNVFLQLEYDHCCCFGPNNMVEFEFFGKKSSGVLIISKGIPSLANEGSQSNIVQLGLRKKRKKTSQHQKLREDLDEYQVEVREALDLVRQIQKNAL